VADKACTDLIKSGCDKTEACAPYGIIAAFGDLATCVARGRLACPALFNAPGTGGSPAAAEACAAATTTESCTDLFDNVPPAACVFHGTAALAGACGADADCSADAYCDFSSGQSCGVCKARSASGGTCVADDSCQVGLVCLKQNNAMTGSCVAPGPQGASCDATHPCLATLGCSAAGTCGPLLGAGAPCTVQNCDTYHGLYCDPQKLVCTQVQTATTGGACGYVTNLYTICTASVCVLNNGSTTLGKCQAPAIEGMHCDLTNGPQCLLPAFCAGGVCILPSTTCR
jgi:hypothetical protein